MKLLLPIALIAVLTLTFSSCHKATDAENVKFNIHSVVDSVMATIDIDINYSVKDYINIYNSYDSIYTNLTTIINSIILGDSKGLASVTNFPIWRPYPEKSIENAEELQELFDTFFDDSLKNSLRKMNPTAWDHVGWRGYMFNNGRYFWADDYGKLNFITYESKRLLDMRARLHKEEQQLIDEASVWETHDCFLSEDSTIFIRLESFDGVERLHLFPRDTALTKTHYVYNGDVEIQGSCHNKMYVYVVDDENVISLWMDSPSCLYGAHPYIISFPDSPRCIPRILQNKSFDLNRAYWREVKQWWGVPI